jgi:hypothetical protein
MRDGLKYFSAGIVVLGVLAAATVLAVADDWNAEWQIRPALSVDKVRFTVRNTNGLGRWSTTRDVPIDRFRGFSLSMLGGGGPAKFEYVGDAGRLLCQGRFGLGSGSGSFTFEPNRDFAKDLVAMGYDAPDDDQLFSMLTNDVDRRFARGVRDEGLNTSTRGLVELRTHGLTLDYIRNARALGYRSLSADDFVQLRIHGVATDYLGDLKAAGYTLDAQDIVQLRIHGVGSDYLRDLKRHGLNPPASDLAQYRMHGVTAEYLKALKDAGYSSLRAEQITQLRNHGVDAELVADAKRLGYDFAPEEFVNLRIHGVDGAYLQRLRDAGMRDLSADQIAKLRTHGVD